MTMTKKQRRARGLDRQVAPAPGALPWKPRDISRTVDDGSSEVVAQVIVDANGRTLTNDMDEDVRAMIVEAVNGRPLQIAALGAFSRWAIDVATLGELADLEARMTAVGVSLQQVGAWAGKDGVPFAKETGSKETYLDPMSILEDSVEIMDVLLADRESVIGEKDEIVRDLVKRIKRVTGRR